ncbi:hypothetical protein CFP56_004560 [Quercus suber]|uniref:Uncharacterized protein n=1 Tax=Quercus suber TaxID=58331 RepID=A0AAW0LBT6_QUESU
MFKHKDSWKTKGMNPGGGGVVGFGVWAERQGNAHIEAVDEGFFFTNCIKRGTKAEFLDKVHPENGFHCPIAITTICNLSYAPKAEVMGNSNCVQTLWPI